MTPGRKVEAVVANWCPRSPADGIDWFDLTRTLDAVTDWDDWADAWADRIVDVRHAHRIAAALGDRATVRLEPDGNHSCNNLATVVRPAVADRVTDRIEERA
jgi:hypothetical protein